MGDGGVCWKGRHTVTKRSGLGDMIRLLAEYFIRLGLNLFAAVGTTVEVFSASVTGGQIEMSGMRIYA